jgi:hypothetical protein
VVKVSSAELAGGRCFQFQAFSEFLCENLSRCAVISSSPNTDRKEKIDASAEALRLKRRNFKK